MALLRDMQDRIEALEQRESSCLPDHREWAIPLAWALAAVGMFMAMAIMAFAPSNDKDTAEIVCIKNKGEWIGVGWGNHRCTFTAQTKPAN